MPFVKLDCGITDSSLWVEPLSVRITFLTVLTMADPPPSSICRATAPGIARKANLPLKDVRVALEVLTSPDPDSRSLSEEGRRLVRVDGGYRVVNLEAYRERDYTAADRQRRYRQRLASRRNVTAERRNVTDTEDRKTEADSPPAPQGEPEPVLGIYFELLASSYPKRPLKNPIAVQRALFEARKLLPAFEVFEANLQAWKRSEEWTKERGRFVPAPAKWIRDGGYLNPPPQGCATGRVRSGAESPASAAEIAARQAMREVQT